MKKLSILPLVLGALLVASAGFAQEMGLSFNEANLEFVIDGRTMLVPNPAIFNFDSAVVWVVAYDIPQVFGYEYNLSSTDATAAVSEPVIYPSEGLDFGRLPGDVRVGAGICFQAGSSEAGPNPAQIRLAKHQFTWFTPPTTDVVYCLHPAQEAINHSGATAPQYTECVSNPVSRPFGYSPDYFDNCLPDGCIKVYFEWEADGVTPVHCIPDFIGDPAPSSSWGALKAAY